MASKPTISPVLYRCEKCCEGHPARLEAVGARKRLGWKCAGCGWWNFLKAHESQDPVRDALVALWTDRRSDKHAELYAEAMAALGEWRPPEVC